jgi:hypothetical protein
VAVKLYYSTADPDCKVGCHEAVASAIPLLIKPLEDDKHVPGAIFEAIAKLAKHGEWLESLTAQSDLGYKVEFQSVIAERIGQLPSHGEWKFKSIVGGTTDPDD